MQCSSKKTVWKMSRCIFRTPTIFSIFCIILLFCGHVFRCTTGTKAVFVACDLRLRRQGAAAVLWRLLPGHGGQLTEVLATFFGESGPHHRLGLERWKVWNVRKGCFKKNVQLGYGNKTCRCWMYFWYKCKLFVDETWIVWLDVDVPRLKQHLD